MRQDKIDNVQVLRGVAATLVAAVHVHELHPDPGAGTVFRFAVHGHAGVDIFFVLSGFLIYLTASNAFDARRFVESRFWRIMPPYWASLALYVLVAVTVGGVYGLDEGTLTIERLLASVFLVPGSGDVVSVAWTLWIELIFYGFFALFLVMFGPRRYFLAMGVWVVAGYVWRGMDTPLIPFLVYALSPYTLEFLLGSVVAWVYMSGVRRYRTAALIVGAAMVLTYLYVPVHLTAVAGREVVVGIPAALLLYGLLDRSWRVPGFLVLWGEASYILYMNHVVIYGLAIGLIGPRIFGSDLALAGMMLLTIGVSMALHALFERPYQHWYKALMRRRREAGLPGVPAKS